MNGGIDDGNIHHHRLPHAGAARAGAEHLARLPPPRDAPLRRARRADRRRTPGHDVEPHHLRAGHRRQHRLRRRPRAGGRLEPLRRRDLRGDSRSRTCGARPTSSARSTTDSNGADGFVSLEVSPGARPRHARDHRRGGAALAGGGPAQRHDQDPRHRGGVAGDRALPHRRHQHQHHAALFGGALPEGGRGVSRGAGGAACRRASRSTGSPPSPRSS